MANESSYPSRRGRLRLGRRRARRLSKTEKRPTPRGFYIFPNLVTSTSLLLGFYAITEAFAGNYVKSCWAIYFATFFDAFDGKIARLTNTTSEFGQQYDSLSDLVTFGVAPAVILWNFALQHSFRPRWGWMVAFMFLVCGALRLGRYNIRPTSAKRFFEGMPIPAAANVMILAVLFTTHMGWVVDNKTHFSTIPNIFFFMTVAIALLMVSTIPFYGFKDVDLFRRHKFWVFFVAILSIAFIFQDPEIALFAIIMVYTVSGPVFWYWNRRKAPEADSGSTESRETESA
ncbi:MAG: CDP-diacylglycerol--serine O-phosphatidyltransferase [Deltaproteobacteria bacterium]|nr:CDP-diacylglycerol--serine O-phosphatidyltransferase [bacterium]MCB9475502.1 CDP-diacylglycerol--serine O-phosphatidyltransferase [Deltaproteobacteria bacterium]MCB9488495.1 CDP-diacylglycerol--serine O-phosphatidyltransferase [Deltaproteobacteria bacterium]